MIDPAMVRDNLVSLADSKGGWGYAPDLPPHLEPTCLALLALSADSARYQAAMEGGLAFLDRCAIGDGRYVLQQGRPEAVWPSALVLFVHAVLGVDRDWRATAASLLALKGRDAHCEESEEVHDIDLSLPGWPWAEDNFSWVEPTAWAVLALRRIGLGSQPRVADGIRLLLDRVLDEGGLNYGNRNVFGRALEPIPGPSSLALIALQGQADDPRVRRSLAYLADRAPAGDDLEHLAWIQLALHCHGSSMYGSRIDELRARIESALSTRSATPYLKPAPLRLALTALALDLPVRNPFQLPANLVEQPVPKDSRKSDRTGSLTEWFRGKIDQVKVQALTQLTTLPPQAVVHIAPVSDYNADLADVLCRQFDHFREQVPLRGKRVVLKPNLVEYHRDKVINTDPRVVAAAIELCRREGAADVIVAEGPGHWRNVEYLVAASGLGDVLRTYKVPFVDLNHDEPIKRLNLGRLTKLDHLYMAKTIVAADVVISMPRLKTHHWAVATLSMKNLFGTLPGICYGWPKNELHWRGIDNSIVDIACTRTPELAIVDGIVGMEGDGPLNGTPRAVGVLVMGADLIAVDATCCRLMQLDPERIGYLGMGHRKKLGLLAEAQIEQRGETIAGRAQPFDTLPHFRAAWKGRTA